MGLALRWARAGETIIIGSREEQRAQQAAASIQKRIGGEAKISGMENSAACAAADILMLDRSLRRPSLACSRNSSPQSPKAAFSSTPPCPSLLAVGGRASRTLGVWQGSAAQQAAELVPDGVSVVAAFHNVSAELLGTDTPLDCDVIVCSDDPDAAQLTRELAAKIPGVRAIDGGKLENARIVEQITALLIGMNFRHKGHAGIRITGLPPNAYR